MKSRIIARTILFAAISVGILSSFISCEKKPSDERPVMMVSINPQRQMLEQIVGDGVRIVTLLPNGENPETYDPSAADRKAVADADMYFSTGYLTFEGNLALNNGSVTNFVDVSQGIEPVYGTHGHNHGSTLFLTGEDSKRSEADPHVWTSVRNAKTMVNNMANALARTYPDSANVYLRRAEAYNARLDSLDRSFAAMLDTAAFKSFMVWHPSLSYFARDYDLEQIAIGHETKEPSATGLKSVIDHAKKEKVKVFFYQQSLDSRKAEAIGASINARMEKIDPLNYDWEGTLTAVADAIANP